jgi:bacillithiol biosynthesis deacetylase BshB1
MSTEAFDILAVAAHPDDVELIMGGTLAREAGRGRRVAILDLTRGESGSRGTPETRVREAQEAARILGVVHRESLTLPDARLQAVPEHRDPVIEVVRRLRPQVVLAQHWEQRHPDHAAASRLTYEACLIAGLRNYVPTLGPAWRPRKLAYAATMTEVTDIRPTFVVDITPVWEQKLEAVGAYASQWTPSPGETGKLPLDLFREHVELAGRRHGDRIGVRYGEGWVTREPLVVDDLLALVGESL